MGLKPNTSASAILNESPFLILTVRHTRNIHFNEHQPLSFFCSGRIQDLHLNNFS